MKGNNDTCEWRERAHVQGVDGSRLRVDERRLGVDGRRRDPDDALRVRETTRTTARDTREPTRLRARTAR